MQRRYLRLSSGSQLAYAMAGEPSSPTVLLLHGFPSSGSSFRDVIAPLTEVAHVVAPDLPGAGESDPLEEPTFSRLGDAILELLTHLHVGPRFIYLHDWGAPVGIHVAMKRPDLMRGLIVQNANVHHTGLGPLWKDAFAFWSKPDEKNTEAAMSFLTLEGMRAHYVMGVPPDVAARISPARWEEDWRVLNLPGRMDSARALIREYGTYVQEFDAIAAFLAKHQPPAVMVWGRHDGFYDIAETVSWMQDLPRMEAHIFDGGHFLLETHARPVAEILRRFLRAHA